MNNNIKNRQEFSQTPKKNNNSKIIIIAVFVLFSINFVGCIEEDSQTKTSNVSIEATTSSVSDKASAKATEAKTEKKTEKETEASIPTEYKSALNKAKQYNKSMFMSKQGLYEQLTSEYGEKFSEEAAQYAIDNLNADWKENALKKAEQYQSMMSMSPSAIYDQLVSEHGEGFTADEAQYAIDNLK